MKFECRKCKCTYFEKVNINQFHDYEGSLYSNLSEVSPASDIKGFRCSKCQTLNIPNLGYNSPQADRDLAKKLLELSDGGEITPEKQVIRSRRIAEGHMTAVQDEESSSDPALQGTFVRK